MLTMESDSFASLDRSDRLRILTDELRYHGPEKWILTSLDFLADELEFIVMPGARKWVSNSPRGAARTCRRRSNRLRPPPH
jgi:hypothetical protein